MAAYASYFTYILIAGIPIAIGGISFLLSAFWHMSFMSQLLVVVVLCLIACSPFFFYILRSVSCISWRWLYIKFVKPDPKTFLEDHFYDSIVLPSDLDMFLHMNNARYSLELDFARNAWYSDTGFGLLMMEKNFVLLMAATAIRFRKSLELYQRFRIKTKVVYWTEEAFYIEHKFLSKYKDMDDFVYCVILAKMNVSKGTTDSALTAFFKQDAAPKSPEPSEEVAQFIKYNEASSQVLKTA